MQANLNLFNTNRDNDGSMMTEYLHNTLTQMSKTNQMRVFNGSEICRVRNIHFITYRSR